MRTFISLLLSVVFGVSCLIAPALASTQSSLAVLEEILNAQGVTDPDRLDCDKVSLADAKRYGEAYVTESIGVAGIDREKLLEGFAPEEVVRMLARTGLRNLGCLPEIATGTPSELQQVDAVALTAPIVPSIPPSVQSINISPFRGGNMGFIATWTTIVWMFSALGFAVFMVWITSSKFRFQFRKMAEGEFDMNDKAMSILKERFARGEVTKEQFDKMRRDIVN